MPYSSSSLRSPFPRPVRLGFRHERRPDDVERVRRSSGLKSGEAKCALA